MTVEGRYFFTARAWCYPGKAGWTFVTLPESLAEEIRDRVHQRAFGRVPVTATVGTTTWVTSIFADKAARSYLLPLRADIREAASINEGDEIAASIVV